MVRILQKQATTIGVQIHKPEKRVTSVNGLIVFIINTEEGIILLWYIAKLHFIFKYLNSKAELFVTCTY